MARRITTLTLFISALLVALPGLALDADTPFGVSTPGKVQIDSGGEGSLEFTFGVLDENWFLYRDMSSVSLTTEGSPLKVAEAVFPKGKVKFDKVSEREREIFGKSFVVRVAVNAAGVADGVYTLDFNARWQGCNKPGWNSRCTRLPSGLLFPHISRTRR